MLKLVGLVVEVVDVCGYPKSLGLAVNREVPGCDIVGVQLGYVWGLWVHVRMMNWWLLKNK